MNSTALFRFHDDLAFFLAPRLRGIGFAYVCARAATLARIVRDGDTVEVLPWPAGGAAAPEGEPRFLADAHLGGLARFLRLLGFDTEHDHALGDAAIRRLAPAERRIVLTRDRELLKCAEIAFGCYVRALRAGEQLREVAARYGLASRARPFTFCLRCNLPLTAIEPAAVAHRVPDKVRALHRDYRHCPGCDRVYWPGSHYERLRVALKGLLPEARGVGGES